MGGGNIFPGSGVERLDTLRKDGEARRARYLYTVATTAKSGDQRREALLYLGALQRGGSPSAARALEWIRKKAKGETDPGENA